MKVKYLDFQVFEFFLEMIDYSLHESGGVTFSAAAALNYHEIRHIIFSKIEIVRQVKFINFYKYTGIII